jgi:molybdopterin converting factor small subunit
VKEASVLIEDTECALECAADGAGAAGSGVLLSVVRARLLTQFPALAPVLAARTTLLALNSEYVEREREAEVLVHSGDEVAVIPVVSGG